MKTKSLVSIIIPTYNRAWILSQAIDSVLNQTYCDRELIVIDDGSTDNTQKLLATYGEKIQVILQENKGVSAARNRGIEAASGEYIALLDSDDEWLPEKLKSQVEFFKENPGALICQTQEIWIRNGQRVNPKNRHKKQTGMIFESSLSLCLVSPSAVMFKRDLIVKTGLFDEIMPACEDYDLWLRVSCKYPIYLIDKDLIIKRGGHEDQLSRQPGLDKYRIYSIKKALERDILNEKQRKSAIHKLKEKCAIYAAGCLKRGREEEAKYYIQLAGLSEKGIRQQILNCKIPILWN